MTGNDNWTTGWPTESGHYWFYGYPYGKRPRERGKIYPQKPILTMCKIGAHGVPSIDRMLYGYPEYNIYHCRGLFQRIEKPEIPSDAEKRLTNKKIMAK